MFDTPALTVNESHPPKRSMMNSRCFRLTVTAVALLLFSPVCFSEDVPRFVNVAFFRFEPQSAQKSGARALAVLRAHGIDQVQCVASSAGMTISVPAQQTQGALRLLANAINKESLQLTLVTPGKAGSFIVVTPAAILKNAIPQ